MFRGVGSDAITGSSSSGPICAAGFQAAVGKLIDLFNVPDVLSRPAALPALAAQYFTNDATIIDIGCSNGLVANYIGVYGANIAPAVGFINGTLADGLHDIGVDNTGSVVRLMHAHCRADGVPGGTMVVRWAANEANDLEIYKFKYDDQMKLTVLAYLPNLSNRFEDAIHLIDV